MKPSAALPIPAFLTISFAAATCVLGQQPATDPRSDSAAYYGQLPLSFEANQGQTDSSVQFLSHGRGYTLFLRSGEAVLVLRGAETPAPKADAPANSRSQTNEIPASPVRMQLVGSHLHAIAVPEDPQITRTNYFLGNNPAKWQTDIPNYSRIRYRSVYDGIDIVYYGNQRQLEYDFVVAPGSSPASIRLRFTAASEPRIDPHGDLLLAGANGEAILHKPLVYQEKDGHRQLIPGSFRRIHSNTVGFAIGSYDRTRPLIIDPVLVYSTYLGGSGADGHGDQGNGIAVDSAGSAYVVGTTYSTNFPLSATPFQSQNNAALAGHGSTVFVSKFNPTGTALLYSTYLGGSGGDEGYAIALDSSGNAYITGTTYSTDFPVTCGVLQTVSYSAPNGAPTAFVSKLNPSGSALVYSTYLGGAGNDSTPSQGDVAQSVAVDSTGNAYVAGYTSSSDFPVTDGAFQTHFAASPTTSNAFVTKLNTTATALVYSTFLGGSGSSGTGDYANSIAINASGDAFVAGSTGSANFPVSSGAFQRTLQGSSNAFVTELNPAGNDVLYSTLLGGNVGDSAQAIALDSGGYAYIAGFTHSSNFPTTSGVVEGATVGNGPYYATTIAGSTPAGFVAKLLPNGSALEYSTYLEGPGTSATGLAVDSAGDTYIAGSAAVPGAGLGAFGAFQTTPDALPAPASSGTAAFLVKLNPSATVFNYATLIGGNSNDGATALALDSAGNAYLTGFANSTDFPTTAGAFQTANNAAAIGASNAFASKFVPAAEANTTTYPAPPSVPIPTSMTLISEQGTWSDDCVQLNITAIVSLNTGVTNPPPTGGVEFLVGDRPPYYNGVYGTWGGNTPVSIGGSTTTYEGISGNWQAFYLGDSEYLPSDPIAGGVEVPPCTPSGPTPVKSGSPGKLSQTANTAAAIGASNAFVGKFALASEASQTAYPSSPAAMIDTSMTVISDQAYWLNDGLCDEYVVQTVIDLNTGAPGPPPSGEVMDTGPWLGFFDYPVTGTWTGTTQMQIGGNQLTPGYGTAWTAYYSGDSIYWNSNVSGDPTLGTCTPNNSAQGTGAASEKANPPRGRHILTVLPHNGSQNPASSVRANSARSTLAVVGPKFAPQPAPENRRGNVAAVPFSSASCSLPALTVTVNPETRLYGANNPNLTYTVTGLLNGDMIEVATQTYATNKSPVGAYNVTAVVRGAALDNYNLTVKDATLTVTQAPLTVTLSSASRYYGSSNPVFAYKIVGSLNGDSFTVTASSPATAASPLGTYPITATLSGSALANYALSIVGATLTVTKRPLDVIALTYYSTYGQTPPPPTKFVFSGFANGDTASVVSGAPLLSLSVALAPNTPAATYPIQVAFGTLSATNYTFVTVPGQGVLRVLPASLKVTVSPAAASRGYGAANPTYTNTVTGLVNGDTVRVIDQPSSPTTPAGTYPITVTLSGPASANYTASVVNGAKLTITPAPLTVTVLPASAQRTYGGANPTFTYSAVGLLNGDTLAPSTTATATSPVGSYPVTVSGAALTNYTLTLHGATLLITKAPLYISAKNVDSTYGQIPPPPTTYTLTGFVNGDTASVVTGAPVLTTAVTSTTPVGNYKIGVQVGTLTATNYYFDNFSSGEGSVEVGKAPLTIRPNSFTIHAGNPLPTFTYTITGFVNGDTQATATIGTPALTTTAPNNTTPGRYYIIASTGTLTAQNYSFNKPSETTNGILTILAN